MGLFQLALLITSISATTITVYPTPTSAAIPISSNAAALITSTTNLYAVSSSPSSIDSTTTYQTTAITACHFHESVQFCIDGAGNEGIVSDGPTNSGEAPTEYTGCHVHDATETFCLDQNGSEVVFIVEAEDHEEGEHDHDEHSNEGKNCHFHAGVEHCVGGDEEEPSCEKVDRDYNIPLRIGLLFVILVTSALGSIGPVLISKFMNISTESLIFVILKQFGTGVIISTAFVHLITHAELMWSNKCLTGLKYEATGSAITMTGLFLAFLIEYIGHRVFGSHHHHDKGVIESADDIDKDDIVQVDHEAEVSHPNPTANNNTSVVTMELGIIFHSILIGITLVVAADSAFITLFIVIVFHQFFEGIALGSRIAELHRTKLLIKLVMGGIFAVITPIGMAIGIGVLSEFNGNDKSTLIALGTLDSFSAGVLLWTGLVEMWASDWVFGSLAHSGKWTTLSALASLVTGMILMSLLGKWA